MKLLSDIHERRLEPELMDDPGLPPELHVAALRGLARINALSRSAASIWSVLRPHLIDRGARPLRVMDLACGGGDVSVSIARLAARDGIALRVEGCDVSPSAIAHAKNRGRGENPAATFLQLDALSDPLPEGCDAVVSNLFLHHLSRENAVAVLKKMSRAAPVVVVNDLERGPVGHAGAVVGTRLLSRSPIVHTDGPRSVRAAFTRAEAREIAALAGLDGAVVRRAFPWRWLLDWADR